MPADVRVHHTEHASQQKPCARGLVDSSEHVPQFNEFAGQIPGIMA